MSVLADHPVFSRFPPWRGHVAAGYVVNFVGQLIDVEFLRGFSWATLDRMVDRYESPGYGQIYEETFEWLIMLEAILAAKDTFTMIDLGSGFGRWLIGGACAARLHRPELKLRLIGVEPQSDHHQWALKHFTDNGFDPRQHKLIEAGVATSSGSAFLVDSPDPSGFWGQYVTADASDSAQHVPGSFSKPVRLVTLKAVMQGEGVIDYIDMDIQNAEKTVVPANMDLLTRRVRRMHVETHWPETHRICEIAFRSAGWHIVHSFPPNTVADSEFGKIEIPGGGVLTVVNPRTLHAGSIFDRFLRLFG